VYAPWFSRLAEPHQDELDMLEYAWGRSQHSRLACQVVLGDELDGIRVDVPEQQS
jgi:2Fe-2S ferredoxin